MVYATHLIRPAGVPIKTFGGTASGPEILISGIEKICNVLDGAIGRTMTSVEVLDCMNIIGSIVVAGNVRRSAEIAVGRLDDEDYLMAKRWDLGDIPIERAMSNNTVFVSPEDEPPKNASKILPKPPRSSKPEKPPDPLAAFLNPSYPY